ncbi:MAG: hypothetical protein P9L99_15390 [Candidatus Lernaella stagnicola]|nr:hypothetical protein [Candidatus Lernaella stagnicola]
MRVVFHWVDERSGRSLRHPLTFAYMAAFLEYLDFDAQCSYEPDVEGLLAVNPDVVCILCNSFHYARAVEAAREIKQRRRAKFVLCGPHISNRPESLDPIFDVGLVGEPEDSLHHVLNVLKSTGDLSPEDLRDVPGVVFLEHRTPVVTDPRELIDLEMAMPVPRRDILPRSPFPAVVGGRGSPFEDGILGGYVNWGRYRAFTNGVIAHEIEELAAEKNAAILLDDPWLTADALRLVDLADLLEDKEVLGTVQFEAHARAAWVTDEVGEFWVRLNVTRVVLDMIGDLRDPDDLYGARVDLETLENAIEVCERYEAAVHLFAHVGAPGDDIERIRDLFAFLTEKIAGGILASARVGWLPPLPGTRFWDAGVESGVVREPQTDWVAFARLADEPSLEPKLAPHVPRINLWRKHLQRLEKAFRRPLALFVRDDADMDIEVDPMALRSIVFVVEEEGVSEVLSDDEVKMVRFSLAALRRDLEKNAADDDTALVLFAPRPEEVTMEDIRALRLAASLDGVSISRPSSKPFPLLLSVRAALEFDVDTWRAWLAGDEASVPPAATPVEFAPYLQLPAADLDQPVPVSEKPREEE